MEILGWIICILTCAYGVFCLFIFIYEIFWPVPYIDGPQVLYPFFLRRLITGFTALGFISAAAVTAFTGISKLHLLWFVPVWHFFGIPRWFEWIYLFSKPELIDLIYPESDIPWWFSLICPFSPSLIPDIIRKIHKIRGRKLSINNREAFPTKFVNSTEKTLDSEEFDSLTLAVKNNWPPKSMEEMNKKQRVFFWVGAGAFIYSVVTFILLLLLLVYIFLGFREAEECMPVIYGAMKSIILMVCITLVAIGFIYIFRDKK